MSCLPIFQEVTILCCCTVLILNLLNYCSSFTGHEKVKVTYYQMQDKLILIWDLFEKSKKDSTTQLLYTYDI